jgi:hypothetical protein
MMYQLAESGDSCSKPRFEHRSCRITGYPETIPLCLLSLACGNFLARRSDLVELFRELVLCGKARQAFSIGLGPRRQSFLEVMNAVPIEIGLRNL